MPQFRIYLHSEGEFLEAVVGGTAAEWDREPVRGNAGSTVAYDQLVIKDGDKVVAKFITKQVVGWSQE